MGTWTMDMETSNEKWKPRRFSLIRLLVAHHANDNLSFVRLLTKKQTEESACTWTRWTKRTCPSTQKWWHQNEGEEKRQLWISPHIRARIRLTAFLRKSAASSTAMTRLASWVESSRLQLIASLPNTTAILELVGGFDFLWLLHK